MNRRAFLTVAAGAMAAGALGTAFAAPAKPKSWAGESGPAVYFTRDLSSAGLQWAFEALGATLPGKVGVKVSTGEPGGHHFLNP